MNGNFSPVTCLLVLARTRSAESSVFVFLCTRAAKGTQEGSRAAEGSIRHFDFPAQRRMVRRNLSDAQLFAVFLLVVVAVRGYHGTTWAGVVMSERPTTLDAQLAVA